MTESVDDGSTFTRSAPGPITLLHVDDDPMFLELAAEFLSRELQGVEIRSAESASEGLSILDADPVDCIVSDYDMPGTNGLQFLEAVRERDPDLPFILFTGKGSEEIASEAISAGVTDYLQKETGSDQYAVLANRIETVVDRTWTAAALAESQRRHARLIGNLPGIVYRCANEPEWPMEFVSDGCLEMTGYPVEAFESGDVLWGRDVIHPDDQAETWETVQDALADDESFEVTYRISTAAGNERVVWEQGVGVFDEDGDLLALEGFITDISERAALEMARREVTHRLEAIVQASPEPIVALDLNGDVTLWNEAAEETFGWSAEEVVGGPLPIVPGTERLEHDGFLETVSNEEVVRAEVVRMTRSGEELVLDLSAAPVFDPEGSVVGTMGVLRDLTERHKLESDLRETAQRLETLVEASPEAIVALDLEGNVTVWNEAAEEIFGWSAEEVLGEPYPTVPAEQQHQHEELIEAVVGGEPATDVEIVRRTKSGESITLTLSSGPLRDSEGAVIGTMAVIAEVGERKEYQRLVTSLHDATRELMAAETPQRIAELVVETTTGVLGHPYTAVLLWDEEIEALRVVADTPEAREKTLSPPEVMQRGEGVSGTAFATGEPIVIADRLASEWTIAQEDTGVRSACVIPLGEHGVYVLSSDVPDAFDERNVEVAKLLAANAEAALDRATREVKLRDRELALERQNERLERFASVLSHDLRTPLNVALGRLQMLDRDDTVDAIDRAIRRMDRMVSDVLAIAREGQAVRDPKPVSVGLVVRDAWAAVDTADAELECTVTGELPADATRLGRLFQNLLKNAVEHGGSDVVVRVGALPDGFYVEDDGRGIPPEQREAVFDFGHTTSDSGNGFGLAIVEEIVQAHGWEIEVTSGDHGGARFEVTGVGWQEV